MEFCGPCKFRGKDTRAVKHCVTCQEPQCKTCADIHSSSKATRYHLLLNIEDLKMDSKTIRDLNQFQICKDHPEKKLQFFCTDHGHLLCSTCLLNTQRLNCKSVIDIESAGEQLTKCKFNEQINTDLECIVHHCNEKERQIQGFIDKSHKEKQEFIRHMDNSRHRIMIHLNKCKMRILNEVDRNLKTQVTELGRQQTLLRTTHQTLKESKDILQKIASDNSKADLFRCILSIIEQLQESQLSKPMVTTKRFTHSVQLSPAFVSLLVSLDTFPIMQCRTLSNTKTYIHRVNLNSNMNNFLEASKVALSKNNDKTNYSSADAESEVNYSNNHNKHHDASTRGSGDTSTRDFKATLFKSAESKPKNNVKLIHKSDVTLSTSDGKKASINGIITLFDGSIVISDCKWSRLIRLNEDLTFRDSAELSKLPGHMTSLNERYMVVCLPTANRIAFIAVSPELKWMRNFITEYTPNGVHALDAKRLLVSMVNDNKWLLQIRTIEGEILQHIGKTRSILDAEHISSLKMTPSSPRYFLQCCQVSYTLYCFQANGKEIFKHSIMSPTGIHVDSTGAIYVLESFGMLHILSKSGVLLQKVPIPKKANGITCNRTMDRLIITRQSSAVLGVFNIIHQ
ncbi:uncharacterized protein LOC123548072 [Mercenaria mercenaria]|uniref:uncharacterized protein LOC123548072 n=1 Tax=Mercenaria mercenaria TaxID=6596 RepID=UPI00234F0580|nr:uncharacterized protein LOC123548072 [Mercenaria mercenaria]